MENLRFVSPHRNLTFYGEIANPNSKDHERVKYQFVKGQFTAKDKEEYDYLMKHGNYGIYFCAVLDDITVENLLYHNPARGEMKWKKKLLNDCRLERKRYVQSLEEQVQSHAITLKSTSKKTVDQKSDNKSGDSDPNEAIKAEIQGMLDQLGEVSDEMKADLAERYGKTPTVITRFVNAAKKG